jgi:hypothetical protein
LRELVSEALAGKLGLLGGDDKPWLKTFGKLRSLPKETARINQITEEEFGWIEREFRYGIGQSRNRAQYERWLAETILLCRRLSSPRTSAYSSAVPSSTTSLLDCRSWRCHC